MGIFVRQFSDFESRAYERPLYVLTDRLTTLGAASGKITLGAGKSTSFDIVAIATVEAAGSAGTALVGDTFATRTRVTCGNVSGTVRVVNNTSSAPWVDADSSMVTTGLSSSASNGSLVVSYANPSTIGTGGVVSWKIEALEFGGKR